MDINNKEMFNDLISKNKKVLVDFWAPWCNPCKQMEPLLKNIEEKITVAKCNVDENNMLPAEFGIKSVPTCVLFKDGEIFDVIVGYCSGNYLDEAIEKM